MLIPWVFRSDVRHSSGKASDEYLSGSISGILYAVKKDSGDSHMNGGGG